MSEIRAFKQVLALVNNVEEQRRCLLCAFTCTDTFEEFDRLSSIKSNRIVMNCVLDPLDLNGDFVMTYLQVIKLDQLEADPVATELRVNLVILHVDVVIFVYLHFTHYLL